MKGDLGMVYKLPHATFTAEANIVDFSSCRASALTASGPISAGGSVDLTLAGKSPEISNFTLGVGYALPKLFFGLRASNKLTEYSGIATYDHAKNLSFFSSAKYSTKKASTDLIFGGLYCCAPTIALKLKATTEGIVSFSAKQTVGKAFSVVGATELSLKDIKDAKFGVTATLG